MGGRTSPEMPPGPRSLRAGRPAAKGSKTAGLPKPGDGSCAPEVQRVAAIHRTDSIHVQEGRSCCCCLHIGCRIGKEEDYESSTQSQLSDSRGARSTYAARASKRPDHHRHLIRAPAPHVKCQREDHLVLWCKTPIHFVSRFGVNAHRRIEDSRPERVVETQK